MPTENVTIIPDGKLKYRLSTDPDGRVCLSIGRHRMFAGRIRRVDMVHEYGTLFDRMFPTRAPRYRFRGCTVTIDCMPEPKKCKRTAKRGMK